jgi:MFS transporter, YNFM family, putative membrane transport protein
MAVIAVGLAGFSAFLDLYATQSLLPLLAGVFRASALQVSMTVSATTTAVALAAPIIGPLADVAGRKRVIVGAVFCLSVPTLLAASSRSLMELLLWRFAQGLFLPAIFAVTIAYVSEEWEGRALGRAMATYVTGNIIGGVSGRFLTGLVAARFGWHWSFVLLGVLNLVAGLCLLRWLPSSKRFRAEPKVLATFRMAGRHLLNPRLWAAYAVGFNVLFSIVATFTYVNFYLAGPPFRLGTVALGSIFAVYLAGAVVTPAAGRWLGRVGYRTVFACAMGFALAGVLLTLVTQLVAVLVGLTMCASGIFVCQAAANSYVGAAAGRARSSAAGWYVAFYYAGGTAGATLPGLVWRAHGWVACVALIATVQCLTAACALLFWGRATGIQAASPAAATQP